MPRCGFFFFFAVSFFAESSQDDRRPVGKFDHQRQFAAHALHIAAQGGEIEVRPLLDARDTFLTNLELLRQASLGQSALTAHFAQIQLLSDQLRRLLFNAFSPVDW